MHMMGLRASLGGACLLLTTLAGDLSAQHTLALDNGDRLTGRLIRIDGTTWVFNFGLGEAKVPAGRVAALTTADPIGVRLADGTIAAATIRPENGELVLTLADGTVRRMAPGALMAVGTPTDLEALRPVDIGFFRPIGMFWGGTASAGISDKSGNSRSRGISADLEIRRVSPRDRLTFNAGINRESRLNPATDDLEVAVNKYYGSLRADLYFGPTFFAFAETQQERDTFQDIDLRSTYNGGFGVQAVKADRTDLRFSASGGARIEDFVANGSETAAVMNLGTDLRQKLGPATVAWKASWAPNVEDLGDYRIRSSASLTTTVYRGLGFRVGLLNEYNSNPRPGIEKHDMLLTTTLAYSVGNGN